MTGNLPVKFHPRGAAAGSTLGCPSNSIHEEKLQLQLDQPLVDQSRGEIEFVGEGGPPPQGFCICRFSVETIWRVLKIMCLLRS